MLKLSNVYYSLDNKLILNNISFSVTENEFLSILTKNDEIKYSLISIILGLEKMNVGRIELDDSSIVDLIPSKRKIGYISKNPKLREELTVYDNIAYELRKAKIKEDLVEEKVDEIIKELELDNIKALMIKDISLYQMFKVSLARSITFNPEVLIFDDPLDKMNENKKDEYIDLISQVYKFLNKPVIIYFDKVIKLTNKILTISSEGRILDFSRKEVILNYPLYEETKELLKLDKISELNQKSFLIEASLDNNILKCENNEIVLNNQFLNRFIFSKDIKYIELKNEYITYNNTSNSIKLHITKLEENNGCYIIHIGNNTIIRKKSDKYFENMYLFYPLDKCVFKDSGLNILNSIENCFNPALKLNIINRSTGLIRIGNKIINLNTKLNKDISTYRIENNKIINISNKHGTKIKSIKNVENIGKYYILTISTNDCDSDIFVITNQNNEIFYKNDLFIDVNKESIKIQNYK